MICCVSSRLACRVHQLEQVEQFREAVRQMPEVLECHHITGEYDYCYKVALKNRKDLERFVVHQLTPTLGVRDSYQPGPGRGQINNRDPNLEKKGVSMADQFPQTMGQQFGRRSWAEPWKIKMVDLSADDLAPGAPAGTY